jgi:hypothetical protein
MLRNRSSEKIEASCSNINSITEVLVLRIWKYVQVLGLQRRIAPPFETGCKQVTIHIAPTYIECCVDEFTPTKVKLYSDRKSLEKGYSKNLQID